MADGNPPPPDVGAHIMGEVFAGDALFLRDLSEVHLLFDFISGRADKSLSGLRELTRVGDDGKVTPYESPQQVISEVTEITYPPEGSLKANAKKAALIIAVKDKLNYLASPARGLTVAFTAMFAGIVGPEASDTLAAHDPASAKFYTALNAYPDLQGEALAFRRYYRSLPLAAWALIIFICGINLVLYLSDTEPKDGSTILDLNTQWRTYLAVVALPTVYGLLGTLAGCMRTIGGKVRESTLSPRDYLASLVGLGLGAVAGLIVGLVIANSRGNGAADKANLSLAALSFIAGFGSEAFFRYLEGLLPSIFPANPPAAR